MNGVWLLEAFRDEVGLQENEKWGTLMGGKAEEEELEALICHILFLMSS
jgi:hypothetical protein